MCRSCDRTREYVQMLLDYTERPVPDGQMYQSIADAKVAVDAWGRYVRRALELVEWPDLAISSTAIKVLKKTPVADLARRATTAMANLEAVQLPVLIDRGEEIYIGALQHDPKGNRGRFVEQDITTWGKYFDQPAECKLSGKIVGWVNAFEKVLRPVVERMISLLMHRYTEVRSAAAYSLSGVDLESLAKSVGQVAKSTVCVDGIVLPEWVDETEVDDSPSGRQHGYLSLPLIV